MIKFNYFDRQYASLEKEVDSAVKECLQSSWYVLGKQVKKFEQNLADFTDHKYAAGVASGTDALVLSLMALGVCAGDEVITTDITAYPTITAIESLGAIPVCVDILEKNCLIDPSEVERAINSKTKAIIPVHLYGQMCNVAALSKISTKYKVPIIEDCAQSIGARFERESVGKEALFTCYSFYPTKNLGAYGDAGAICTNSEEMYEKLLKLRNYGQSQRYIHSERGINSRLDEIQAAILNVKLPYLPVWNEKRKSIARQYLSHLPKKCLLGFEEGSVFHLFPLLLNSRDSFMEFLKIEGIETLIHYPIPVSHQEAFTGERLNNPISSSLSSKLVSIPICPELSDEEVDRIISVVNKYFELGHE